MVNLDKLVSEQIYKLIDKTKLFRKSQHGVRVDHSIETAVIEMTQYIFVKMDDNELVTGLSFDHTRAIILLSIDFVGKKLEALGVPGYVNQWIESYLNDRKINVNICSLISDEFDINIDVVGPLIFILS